MRARRRIRSRKVNVGKGLGRLEALRRAIRKSPGDFRGFTYNHKTGEAILT